MSEYKILVADNAHYMDPNETYEIVGFATAEAAIKACKKMVDTDLKEAAEPGSSAEEVYHRYKLHGRDPVPVSLQGEPVSFSAWTYARERSSAFS